jgi:HPt (histidine-containing phosphotransfer) domain-containing protein
MDVLDSATLETLRSLQDEGEDDLLTELIDLFLVDAPTRLAGVRDAVGREDWPSLASWAHSLKGSSSSLGALKMAEVCARLEQHGRHGGAKADAETLLRELEGHYALVSEALRRERNGSTH